MVERVVTKQLGGVEDLLLSLSTVIQARQSGNRTITGLNASHMLINDLASLFTATEVNAALQEAMVAINDNADDIAANLAALGALDTAKIDNSSFEIADSVTPTHPANWTVAEDLGGTVALDTTDVVSGTKSVRCTSTGTGGGTLISNRLLVSTAVAYLLKWDMKASVVDIRNDVEFLWYDKDSAYLSTTSLYSEASNNPTVWKSKRAIAVAPVNATAVEIKLTGCNSLDVTVGNVLFDGIELYEFINYTHKGADIASAATLLVNIPDTYHNVTGVIAITALEAIRVGVEKTLEFNSILTLTHHATNLIIPGSANIVVAPGDIARLVEYASGQHKVTSFQRAANSPDVGGVGSWEDITRTVISGGETEIDFTGLDNTYDVYRLRYDRLETNVDALTQLRVGTGVTPIWQTGNVYNNNANSLMAVGAPGAAAGESLSGYTDIFSPADTSVFTLINSIGAQQDVTGAPQILSAAQDYSVVTAVTALRLIANAGSATFDSGVVTLQGLKK